MVAKQGWGNHNRGVRMKNRVRFYKRFYPGEFQRDLRGIPLIQKKAKLRLSWTCKNPRHLSYLIDRLDTHRDIYIQIVDQKTGKPDRLFLDFDVENKRIKDLWKEAIGHLNRGNMEGFKNTREKIKKTIIKKKLAKEPLEDALALRDYFLEAYNVDSLIFFSGAKGFHLYTPMKPTRYHDYNRTISYFAKRLKDHALPTLDLAVCKDALVRLGRAPYTMNMKTGLYTVLVDPEDDYNRIMEKALNPQPPRVEIPNPGHLQDRIREYDRKLKNLVEFKRERREQETGKRIRPWKGRKIGDLRPLFRKVLGDPDYEGSDYIMYKCPFPDHDDSTPSFSVKRGVWRCFGCNRRGYSWYDFKKQLEG